jgi:hypothetical protein
MKCLVERLAAKRLSAATIRNIMLVVKLTVASVTDQDGNELCPVRWNGRFIDAPCVDPTKQKRPTITPEQIEQILSASNVRLRMACLVLAASGI